MNALDLKQIGSKNDFYKWSDQKDQIYHQGLPSPVFILGKSVHNIEHNFDVRLT
jgi:hypothetical protein